MAAVGDEETCLEAFLLGFGAVGQHVVQLLLQNATRRRPRMKIVGIADSSGGIYLSEGLPLERVLTWKQGRNQINAFGLDEGDRNNVLVEHFDSTFDMVLAKLDGMGHQVLLDATPVDLEDGGVGLACARFAVSRGCHIVMANKAPLVLAYGELMRQARQHPVSHIQFSATVCGGLPVVNVGRRDLNCARIESVEGIFNSTSNYILSRMENGEDPTVALKVAQENGIAEADPSLDLEGYDTANKLVIICNSVLNHPVTLKDVSVTGIKDITAIDVRKAGEEGEVYRLLASARRIALEDLDKHEVQMESTYKLTVKPVRVKKSSFFGNCVDSDMCVVFRSDEFETISMKTDEKGVFPTAAAMLRDCFTIIRSIDSYHVAASLAKRTKANRSLGVEADCEEYDGFAKGAMAAVMADDYDSEAERDKNETISWKREPFSLKSHFVDDAKRTELEQDTLCE